MAVSKILLRAERLRREVGGKMIVREASFALGAGEVVAITGAERGWEVELAAAAEPAGCTDPGRVLLEGADTSE